VSTNSSTDSSARRAISPEWCERGLPRQLVQAAAADRGLRIGATKVILTLAEQISPRAMLPHILVAFQWAFEMRRAALVRLNGADGGESPDQ
jgi:hypothetical protein